jgi:hypothetical protein
MTTLPTTLVRFRAELEEAIARDLRPRRRRLAVRLAVVAAAVAVAATALTALPGDPGERLVEPASAAERAAAALAASPGAVVHVDMRVEQRSPGGATATWRVESWQQTSPPYDVRQVVTGADGRPIDAPTPRPATAEPLREQVLQLLRDGKLTQTGSAAGRMVSFAWNDGQTRYEYTVAAGTYEPVRWRLSSAGSETTVTFETYEILSDG